MTPDLRTKREEPINYDSDEQVTYEYNLPHQNTDEELDDFIIENLLEEEVVEFKKLLRLQKLLEISQRNPKYFI